MEARGGVVNGSERPDALESSLGTKGWERPLPASIARALGKKALDRLMSKYLDIVLFYLMKYCGLLMGSAFILPYFILFEIKIKGAIVSIAFLLFAVYYDLMKCRYILNRLEEEDKDRFNNVVDKYFSKLNKYDFRKEEDEYEEKIRSAPDELEEFKIKYKHFIRASRGLMKYYISLSDRPKSW